MKKLTWQEMLKKYNDEVLHAEAGASVPGQPKYPGNNPKNDTVKAMVSPGEIVLPNSVTQHPNAPQKAAQFVAKEKAKQNYDDGGTVSPTASPSPGEPNKENAAAVQKGATEPGYAKEGAGWQNLKNEVGKVFGYATGGIIDADTELLKEKEPSVHLGVISPQISPPQITAILSKENNGNVGGTIRDGSKDEIFVVGGLIFAVEPAKKMCGQQPNCEVKCSNTWSEKINVEQDHAIKSDSTNPVLIAQIPTENGFVPLLFDGHHRMYRCIGEGQNTIPGHMFTPEESLSLISAPPDLMYKMRSNLKALRLRDPQHFAKGGTVRGHKSSQAPAKPRSPLSVVPSPVGAQAPGMPAPQGKQASAVNNMNQIMSGAAQVQPTMAPQQSTPLPANQLPQFSQGGTCSCNYCSGGMAYASGGGVLTSKERKHIAKKNFALPGGRYPIHDISHARNALARVSQHGTPEEKAEVRAKVAKKYPSITQHFDDGGTVDDDTPAPKDIPAAENPTTDVDQLPALEKELGISPEESTKALTPEEEALANIPVNKAEESAANMESYAGPNQTIGENPLPELEKQYGSPSNTSTVDKIENATKGISGDAKKEVAKEVAKTEGKEALASDAAEGGADIVTEGLGEGGTAEVGALASMAGPAILAKEALSGPKGGPQALDEQPYVGKSDASTGIPAAAPPAPVMGPPSNLAAKDYGTEMGPPSSMATLPTTTITGRVPAPMPAPAPTAAPTSAPAASLPAAPAATANAQPSYLDLLRMAQQQSANTQRNAALAKAGILIGQGFAQGHSSVPVKLDTSIVDEMSKNANQPINNILDQIKATGAATEQQLQNLKLGNAQQANDPNSPNSQFARNLLNNYASKLKDAKGNPLYVPPTLTAADAPEFLGNVEKIAQNEEAQATRLESAKQNNQYRQDRQQQLSDAKDQAQQQKQTAADEAQWPKFVKDVNDLQASGRSPLGLASRTKIAGQRLLDIVNSPDATTQDLALAANDQSQMVGTGTSTISGAHEATYKNLATDLANAAAYLTSTPQAPDVPEVKKHIADITQKMMDVSDQVIKSNIGRVSVGREGLISRHPDQYQRLLEQLAEQAPANPGTSGNPAKGGTTAQMGGGKPIRQNGNLYDPITHQYIGKAQ